ncbi:unnamed protein product, partial [Musa acuminata subsp. burmannicoides]
MTSLNILANYVKACTRLSRCSNIFYKPSKRISPRMDSALPVRRGHEECDAALLHQAHRHHERAIPWANSVREGGRRRARQGRQPRPLQRYQPLAQTHTAGTGWADGPVYISQCPIRPA